MLIADVDLTDLTHLHQHGSVRNLQQRGKDLYRVAWQR